MIICIIWRRNDQILVSGISRLHQIPLWLFLTRFLVPLLLQNWRHQLLFPLLIFHSLFSDIFRRNPLLSLLQVLLVFQLHLMFILILAQIWLSISASHSIFGIASLHIIGLFTWLASTMILIKLDPATSFSKPEAHIFAFISHFLDPHLFIVLILALIVCVEVLFVLHRRLRFILVHDEFQFSRTSVLMSIWRFFNLLYGGQAILIIVEGIEAVGICVWTSIILYRLIFKDVWAWCCWNWLLLLGLCRSPGLWMCFWVSKLRALLSIIEVLHMQMSILLIFFAIKFEFIDIHFLLRRHGFLSFLFIRVIFKQCLSFHAYTIQYLQLRQVPQQIVNLFFLMEVYTQRFQIRPKCMQGVDCLLYVFQRISIDIDLLEIGKHGKVAWQLGQIILWEIERL